MTKSCLPEPPLPPPLPRAVPVDGLELVLDVEPALPPGEPPGLPEEPADSAHVCVSVCVWFRQMRVRLCEPPIHAENAEKALLHVDTVVWLTELFE